MSAAKHTPGPWVVEFRQPVGVPGVNVAFGIDAQDAISVCSGQSQDDLGSTHAILEAECRANGRLIAAAPELLEALQGLEMFGPRAGEGYDDTFERVAEVFHRETGYLRPGKDCVLHSSQTRGAVWDDWIAKRRAAARAAIAKATGSAS